MGPCPRIDGPHKFLLAFRRPANPSWLDQYKCTSKRGVSVDHASAVAVPKSDPVFLHVKAGMTVIVADTDSSWRMADVIWVDGAARNPKVPTLFQVAEGHGLGSERGVVPRRNF